MCSQLSYIATISNNKATTCEYRCPSTSVLPHFDKLKMFGRESGTGGSAGGGANNNNTGFGGGMSSGPPPVEIDPRARPDGVINSQRTNQNLTGSTGVSSGSDHHNYHQQPHYTKGLTDQQLHEQQQLIQQQLLQQQQHKLQQVGCEVCVLVYSYRWWFGCVMADMAIMRLFEWLSVVFFCLATNLIVAIYTDKDVHDVLIWDEGHKDATRIWDIVSRWRKNRHFEIFCFPSLMECTDVVSFIW